MKVLVTGATGFVGSHVVSELLKQGEEVVATARSETKAKSFSWFKDVLFEPFNFDSENDVQLPESFYSADVVMHLAWSGLPNYVSLNHIKDNLLPSYKLIQKLTSHGVKKILVSGTCLEYGMQSGPIHESAVCNPQNAYAVAKNELRRLLLELRSKSEFDLIWARLFYLYGPGQNKNSLYSQLHKAINENQEFFQMSSGEQQRDFLDVEVVAKYLVGLLDAGLQGECIINCCSGRPRSVLAMVNEWVLERESQIKLQLGYYPIPDYEPKDFWGVNDELKKLLGENKAR